MSEEVIETPKTSQEQVLDYIKHFISDTGYPPTIREIGDAVGLRSTSTIHYHLTALSDKGFITFQPGMNRTITIVDKTPSCCPHCGGGL